MKTVQVADCNILLNEEEQRVVTTFSDGVTLTAAPVYDRESTERAYALGYFGSPEKAVWSMTRDHDLTHALLAEAEGKPHSPTLWSVAHGDPVDHEIADREERIVFLLQRANNFGIIGIIWDTRA